MRNGPLSFNTTTSISELNFCRGVVARVTLETEFGAADISIVEIDVRTEPLAPALADTNFGSKPK